MGFWKGRPAHLRWRPWKRVISCQGNVRLVDLKANDPAPEDSAKQAETYPRPEDRGLPEPRAHGHPALFSGKYRGLIF